MGGPGWAWVGRGPTKLNENATVEYALCTVTSCSTVAILDTAYCILYDCARIIQYLVHCTVAIIYQDGHVLTFKPNCPRRNLDFFSVQEPIANHFL